MEPSERPQTIRLMQYPIYRVYASEALELHRPVPTAVGLSTCQQCGPVDSPYGCATWRAVHHNLRTARDIYAGLTARAAGILSAVGTISADVGSVRVGPIFAGPDGRLGRVIYLGDPDDTPDDDGQLGDDVTPDPDPFAGLADADDELSDDDRLYLGGLAYLGYYYGQNKTGPDGEPLPQWDTLPAAEQRVWASVADGIRVYTSGHMPPGDPDEPSDVDPREDGPTRAMEEFWDTREDEARGANV